MAEVRATWEHTAFDDMVAAAIRRSRETVAEFRHRWPLNNTCTVEFGGFLGTEQLNCVVSMRQVVGDGKLVELGIMLTSTGQPGNLLRDEATYGKLLNWLDGLSYDGMSFDERGVLRLQIHENARVLASDIHD